MFHSEKHAHPVAETPKAAFGTNLSWWSRLWIGSLAWVLVSGVSGCSKEPQFRLNAVHKLTLEKEFLDGEPIPETQIKQVGNLLTALFGTPSEPAFPAGNADIVELDSLKRAAGAVSSDRDGSPRGLYREHCAHCHGISGDGAGPTASFLNPYPRDFRMGRFKFKSTQLYRPPTDEDLRRIIHRGIAGTAMPSFALLPEDEIDALVNYVKYLSIRGQVERKLLEELVNMESDEALVEDRATVDGEDYLDQLAMISDLVDPILKKWRTAESRIVPVPEIPFDFDAVRLPMGNNGKELFFGKANCVQCHGKTGIGDGQTENFDDWTNEWLARANIDPNDKEKLKEFIAVGALKPRKIRPRNLRHRVFRGGSQPEDLFRRIKGGIEGTSMPSAPALTDEEVWSLVAFVLELPFANPVDESEGH